MNTVGDTFGIEWPETKIIFNRKPILIKLALATGWIRPLHLFSLIARTRITRRLRKIISHNKKEYISHEIQLIKDKDSYVAYALKNKKEVINAAAFFNLSKEEIPWNQFDLEKYDSHWKDGNPILLFGTDSKWRLNTLLLCSAFYDMSLWPSKNAIILKTKKL